jgi:hypothetical protein
MVTPPTSKTIPASKPDPKLSLTTNLIRNDDGCPMFLGRFLLK